MRKLLFMPVLIALAMIIPGCGAAAVKAGESQPPGGMRGLNRPSLADTAWVLDGYGNPAALTTVIDGSRITLKWNGTVSGVGGNAGCNIYGGKVTIRDGMLTITELYQTEMASLTPGVMEQEARYLTLLGSAETWNVENGKLIITCKGGEALVYSKDGSIPVPISSLANTRWTLTSFGSGEVVSSTLAGTSVTLNFNETATSVGGTGGVNVYGGDSLVNGSNLKIWSIFSTKMFKDDPPGLMNQESRYFGLLGKAVSFKATTAQLTIYCQDGAFLVFNAA